MTILVTGGGGFIGSHLVRNLLASGESVTVYDSFDPQVHGKKVRPPKAPRLRTVVGDVRNRALLAKEVRRADAVVHLAAAVGVGQSQYQIRHYVDANVTGTATLLDIPEATVRTRYFRARGMLRESLAREVDSAVDEAFTFAGARCDRIVAAVLQRLRFPPPPAAG